MHDPERLLVLVSRLETPARALGIRREVLETERSLERALDRNCIRRLAGHDSQVNLPRSMATFDQLASDQRAIIEIVLRQGKSYEQIGEMLDLPPARVRELARDALGELAPFTAEFIDPQWRGQLADYVLGQQTGPESQATRGHLRRSEPARIWAYSLLDALDDFYEERDRPEIPVGEAGAKPRGRDGRSNGEAPPPPAAAAASGPRARSGSGGSLSPAAQS